MFLAGWLGPTLEWSITTAVVLATSWLLLARRRRARKPPPVLTACALAAWQPKPLVEEDVTCEEPPLMGKIGEGVLNMGAMSFLSLDREESITDDAIKAVRRYGVGSCGPRGFYGTIDVHLELESRLAAFLQVEETCVYSYGFSTVASAIPSYAKKQDIIFADEAVWFAIQKGLDASRSTVHFFKHNDAEHLEQLLRAAARRRELRARRRAFLVLEAIYLNTGEMCPLPRLVALARQFKLRIILDESLSIGVVGARGRGLTELLDVPRHEIDVVVGSLEHAFAAGGGFCAGSHFIVEHQRLSGLGYCFSASLPPPLTRAAISALELVEQRPQMLAELAQVCAELHRCTQTLKHFRARGHELSPVRHLYLAREGLTERLQHSYLRDVAAYCLARGVALAVAAYLRDAEPRCPQPSLRLAASRALAPRDIARACALLDEAYESVGPQPDLRPV